MLFDPRGYLEALGRLGRRRVLGWAALAVFARGARGQGTDTVAVLEAAAARIIPSEDGPGAREAKVGRFIERQLAGDLRELRPAFEQLARLLDLWAGRAYGKPFVALADPRTGIATGSDVSRAAHARAGRIPFRPRARRQRRPGRVALRQLPRAASAQARRPPWPLKVSTRASLARARAVVWRPGRWRARACACSSSSAARTTQPRTSFTTSWRSAGASTSSPARPATRTWSRAARARPSAAPMVGSPAASAAARCT